jgi:hypothetical protein
MRFFAPRNTACGRDGHEIEFLSPQPSNESFSDRVTAFQELAPSFTWCCWSKIGSIELQSRVLLHHPHALFWLAALAMPWQRVS